MTRDYSVLITVLIAVAAVLTIGVVVAIIEDDEPTQAQADEQFCDDVGAFTAALGALRDVGISTPIDEFDDIRANVRTTYEDMIESAQAVRDARVDDLQDTNEDLRAAIDDIEDDASLAQALDSIDDEVEAVAVELGQMLNDVQCGSGQGAQENSDE